MVAFMAAPGNVEHGAGGQSAGFAADLARAKPPRLVIAPILVLVAIQATEDGLAKQSCHLVLAVLAGARIDELVANHVRQPERVIELSVGKQSGIGGDPGTVELKLQAAVEIELRSAIIRFTRWVLHDGLIWFRLNC